MASNKDVGEKIVKKNGTQSPAEIAKKVLERNGHTDVSKSKTPLRESGTTLPPTVKGK